MIFEQIEVKGLAHFSYIVGDEDRKEVAIVDPKRDIDTYLNLCNQNGWKITHVMETHIHADYASGAKELSEVTGAALYLSAYDKGEKYETRFPHQSLADGDSLELGRVKIQALHSPGHTPEHLSFLVFDLAQSMNKPVLMLSGDFLFVGSLGRPDLLGEENKLDLANKLYDSVNQKLTGLSDDLKIYPAHGAGSMCGAGMSKQSFSSLGAERLSNPYLSKGLTREQFVNTILNNVPPLPAYYYRMKELNSIGAPSIGDNYSTSSLSLEEFEILKSNGATVVDLRDYLSFGNGHIPGSLGIGGGTSFVTWASWILPPGDIIFVAPSLEVANESRRALLRVGLDAVMGQLQGGMETWLSAGKPISRIDQIEPTALHKSITSNHKIQVLDVRNRSEFDAGHIAGSCNIMCGELQNNLRSVPKDKVIAVCCGGGYRSTVAASILLRAGFKQLLNVRDGMTGWQKAGLPVELVK